MKKSKRKNVSEEPNLPKAFLFGLGAAIISCIVWFIAVSLTHWQIGIIAVAVGFFVGKATIYGAGYKSSVKIQAIAIILTLLTMLVSQYFISIYFLNQEIKNYNGKSFYSYFDSPSLMGYIVYDSLKSDLLTLVFWAIALYEAYTLTKAMTPDNLIKETIEKE